MSIQSFPIALPQTTLDDLRFRLARTRLPDEVQGAGWDYGTNLGYVKKLLDYWHRQYDWRKQEVALNHFHHFKAEIEGVGIHFIHERGKGPNPLPLVLFHGWPDSFYRYHKLIPLLTDPASSGGDPADSFDVIVPSLPGFGFSDRPRKRGWKTSEANALWAHLMRDLLRYHRYRPAAWDTATPVPHFLSPPPPPSLP